MLHLFKNLIPQPVKNVWHLLRAIVASFWYGFPAKKMHIIGVTGTDGKTTTATMMVKILETAGHRVALASTINFKIGSEDRVNATKYTTMSSFAVQRFLRSAVDAGCDTAVLEVSSHALDQNRLWGIRFDIGVLTNITREHLDYHKTMARYRRAKRKLFERSEKIVINEALPHIEEFIDMHKRQKITYGVTNKLRSGGEEFVQAENIECRFDGSSFLVEGQSFSLNIPGLFNVENALATIAAAKLLRIDLSLCSLALAEIAGVPGRMESIPNDRGVNIIIDYAVTPEALKRVYELIAESQTQGKIIAVLGACGDRDRGKRPIMGEIVDAYADVIILTNEDPYWEDPQRILNEIEKGITRKQKDIAYFRIFDRREAIGKALTLAQKGDTVVITGKGAEETMYTKGKMVPWNDKKVVEETLGKIS